MRKMFNMFREILFSIVIGKQDGISATQHEDAAGQKNTRFPGYLIDMSSPFAFGVQAFIENIKLLIVTGVVKFLPAPFLCPHFGEYIQWVTSDDDLQMRYVIWAVILVECTILMKIPRFRVE